MQVPALPRTTLSFEDFAPPLTTSSAIGSSAWFCSARARGEGDVESDYDVAIFLNGFADRRREVRRMVPVVTDIIEETGAVIHPLPFRAGAWRDRTPLMHEIRLDGMDL